MVLPETAKLCPLRAFSLCMITASKETRQPGQNAVLQATEPPPSLSTVPARQASASGGAETPAQGALALMIVRASATLENWPREDCPNGDFVSRVPNLNST
jgi:hypothetical protein